MGINGVVLKGKTGSPVTGANEFFNREKELKTLMEKIARGKHLYCSSEAYKENEFDAQGQAELGRSGAYLPFS